MSRFFIRDWVDPVSLAERHHELCHYIHFLASPQAAEEWMAKHEGTFALSADDGFRLGRMNNDARFGAVLDRP